MKIKYLYDKLLGKFNRSKKKPSNNQIQIQNLRLQLYSKMYLSDSKIILDNIIYNQLTNNIYEVVVLDLGNQAEITLSWDKLAHLELSKEEIINQAKLNSVTVEMDSVNYQVLEYPECNIELLLSNGFYLGAYLLEVLERSHSVLGYLVIIPNWHACATVELKKGSDFKKIVLLLKELANNLYDHNQQVYEMLSTQVYWYYRNKFEEITIKNISVKIPDDLRSKI